MFGDKDKMDNKLFVNPAFKKKMIFNFGAGGAGFFSEYNSMLYIILYCCYYHINFSIFSKKNRMFGSKGYTYVFKELLLENKNPLQHLFNKRYSDYHIFKHSLKNLYKEKLLLLTESSYKLFTGNYLTQDLFRESRSLKFTNKHFNLPEWGIVGNFHDALSQIVSKVYVFNEDYRHKISELIATLDLPSSYIALHLRGGDKILESDLYDFELYMAKAIHLSKNRNAFVFTDDYHILEELKKKYTQWNFYSFVSKEETGYVNGDFLRAEQAIIDTKMLNLFASIEVIKKAQLFIGTCSSNVGCFLGLYMSLDKVIYVDTEMWHLQ